MMKRLFLMIAVLAASLQMSQAQSLMNESYEMHPKSPAVPVAVTFAGQRVDLSDPDRYERLDRELMKFK